MIRSSLSPDAQVENPMTTWAICRCQRPRKIRLEIRTCAVVVARVSAALRCVQNCVPKRVIDGIYVRNKSCKLNVFSRTMRGALLYESAALPLSYLGIRVASYSITALCSSSVHAPLIARWKVVGSFAEFGFEQRPLLRDALD